MLEDGNEEKREMIAAAKKRVIDAILDLVRGAPFCTGTRTENEGLDSIGSLTQQLDAIERCEQFYGKPVELPIAQGQPAEPEEPKKPKVRAIFHMGNVA